MAMNPIATESPETQKKVWQIYLDYFHAAEKKRRWNMQRDIPWDQCNPNISPAIADVIQTFCMIELYLPDYLAKQLPQVRNSKGRAWMLASWGYEESKHSMVLNDWLLRSKQRTEEQIQDMEDGVFEKEWTMQYDDALASVVYTMVQEVATRVNYRNLRRAAGGQCPALDKVLELVQIDEAAHGHFFRELVSVYLEENREATLERIRMVMNSFAMPADHLLADGRRRIAAVKELNIFDERNYLEDVVMPLLSQLGLTRHDLRGPRLIVPKR